MVAAHALVIGITLFVCVVVVRRLWSRRLHRERAECATVPRQAGLERDVCPTPTTISLISRERLRLHRFSVFDRDHYIELWRINQARFANDVRGAVLEAESILTDILRRRGYAVSSIESWAGDASPEQHRIIGNYVVAREVVARYRRGEMMVQDLGKAMVCYRALFAQLVDAQSTPVEQRLSLRTGTE
jgi:hypothetical protein